MTPTHAPTPCVENGCYRLATIKGRCAQCQLIRVGEHAGSRAAYDQARGGARERGYDRAWERTRARHLRLEPFCRKCGTAGVKWRPNEVDHVIPHRGVKWLFDLEDNLQTLCKSHHSKKTAHERTIPIGMMYPLDLPEAPHARPTALYCGPRMPTKWFVTIPEIVCETDAEKRNTALRKCLAKNWDMPLVLYVPAPRTAERAFWSHIMDVDAELVMSTEDAASGPAEWWDPFLMDQCAEEAMERRAT